jgi:HEPN domain-containing protein
MRGDDAVLAVAAEWVAKAENDLLNATHTLKLGQRCPTDTVCFHAQQCVEKYLKALLVLHGVDFPKTHDLEALASRVRGGRKPALPPEELAKLKRYATVTRYPGAEAISLAEARRAVSAAKRMRRAVRSLLPARAARRARRG